jgi:predicted dehydrogenase
MPGKEISMRKVRYAIIGFGGIAENRIAKEGFGLDKSRFAGHPRAELVGATDKVAARRDAAARLGLKWYESAEAALGDPNIDAMFIATNNLSHAPLARKAIEAGKHCLIEKPITTTLEDAVTLQRLAREREMSLVVDHMMTENAYNRRAKELIGRGAIGDVNDVSLHMEFCYGATAAEAATWRCADPKEIGGPIGDVGSHCLYMAEFLHGSEVVALSCVYTPRTLNIAVENGAFVQFCLRSGVQGTARVAFNQLRGGPGGTLTGLGYEVYGTHGILRGCATLFQLSGHPGEPVEVRLEIDDFTHTEKIKIDSVQNIYQGVIGKHAESIVNRAPLDAADAVHNLKLVLACYESAEHKGHVIAFE